jgi:hypothetical protein
MGLIVSIKKFQELISRWNSGTLLAGAHADLDST